MLILEGKLEDIKNSGFYDKDCWDYPTEEEKMLWQDTNYSDVIYVKAENGRIYETKCTVNELDELFEKLNCDKQFKIKDFYCVFVSGNNPSYSLPEKIQQNTRQLDVYIRYGDEIKKVNSQYVHNNAKTIEQIKKNAQNILCKEIGKILEDGTIDKEYYRQGYIYKSYENFYKRDGICYVSEHDENKIGEAGISYDGIQDEVVDYLILCGVNIEKVPDSIIETMVKDIFDTVDWQYVCSLIQGDEWLEEYVKDFPDEYFFNKENRKNNKEEQQEEL